MTLYTPKTDKHIRATLSRIHIMIIEVYVDDCFQGWVFKYLITNDSSLEEDLHTRFMSNDVTEREMVTFQAIRMKIDQLRRQLARSPTVVKSVEDLSWLERSECKFACDNNRRSRAEALSLLHFDDSENAEDREGKEG